ncbi:vitellogenin-2-like [Dendronephthya gigantea]|uniref:vitellogenin-2-like n=1 Tax=Dendronephthya gigantea TaxID=151771 RepID=UPI00106AA228|nr:vitellogenin-2-like [Dendronephthya gigantea]
MKVLCILLLCLTAAAAIRLGFKRGRRYTYAYEGWVAQGIAEALEKDLAVKIAAKVHFDYLLSGLVRLTLEEVNLLKIADKVLYNDRLETIVGRGERLENVKTALVKACLGSPVKFRFKRNLVEKQIITEHGVPEWCLNIQRAIINQFYLPIRDNVLRYQIRINEISCLGKCPTHYTIIPLRRYFKYKVKRAIGLSRCFYVPYILRLSMPNTDAFVIPKHGRGTAKMLNNFERKAAYMDYDLAGNMKDGFIIYQVVSENVAELTLNGDEYQAGKIVAAHSKQTLKLLAKHRRIPPQPKKIKVEVKRKGLMFVMDLAEERMKTPGAQQRIYEKVSAYISAIEEMVTDDTLAAETAMKITRLVSKLRHCTLVTLRKVVLDIEKITKEDVKRVLLGALAQVGTEPAGIALRECVIQGKFIKQLPEITFGVGWVRGLNTAFMKHVVAICRHQHVVNDAKACRNCWLSFGTLVNRLMVQMRADKRMRFNPQLIFFKHQIAKVLIDGILHPIDADAKVTFVKAIGNAGWTTMDVFKVVRHLIICPTTPLHIKIHAVWAVRHMVRVVPILIRRTLLPVLANPLVDPEIRASCYKVLTRVDLNLATYQILAGVLAREAIALGPRSNQFVSFVVSDLRTSINYDNIDRVKASRARLLLRIIPRAIYFNLLSYSKAVNLPIDAGSNMGVELRLHNIIGAQSFIPRHIHTKLKVNMPGISADFFEFGVRMQGIHDILQTVMGPKGNRQKRSLDILKYIFGEKNEKEEEVEPENLKYARKLLPRLESYIKFYGSEVYWGKLGKTDLINIIHDALFGGKTTKEGGCIFKAGEISCNMPFIRAHMVSEKRYIVPTLVGIPLKYSAKVAAVIKTRVVANVTGTIAKLEDIKARVIIKPTTSFHMHNKVGIWLPIFETSVIVKHKMFSEPNIDFVLSITPNGFNLEAPITTAAQKLLVLRPLVRGLMRTEVVAGDSQWSEIDLMLMKRGFVTVPQKCLGEQYLNVMLCKRGYIVDPEYLRLKLLPTLPYYWLNTWDVVIKKDTENVPKKLIIGYTTNTNDEKEYTAMGKIMIEGKRDTKVTMNPICDKKKLTCTTNWVFQHKKCPAGCKATTKIDYTQKNRVELNTEYGGGKELNNEILVQKQGKVLRVVNTWNELPQWFLEYLRLNRVSIITYLHRYFGIEEVENTEKRCDIQVDLVNKFLADIFVNTTTMNLRRINQKLPIAVEDFYIQNRLETMMKLYGHCMVKNTNFIKTTDGVIVKAEIPGPCPFVLAEDARGEEVKWRIMLMKTTARRQILIIEIGGIKIVFGADKSVKVDGKAITLKTGGNVIAGGKVVMVKDQLFFQANAGFQCVFDGTITIILFSPWYHNRIRGICGNDDGEQWTDFQTRRETFMPERMTRAFLREWVVEGTKCQDPVCKLKAEHIEVNTTLVPRGKVCFTNGRFLQCMAQCTAAKTNVLRGTPCHCFDAGDPLVDKIKSGDLDVGLETMSVDLFRPVIEHVACQCNCQ